MAGVKEGLEEPMSIHELLQAAEKHLVTASQEEDTVNRYYHQRQAELYLRMAEVQTHREFTIRMSTKRFSMYDDLEREEF